MARKLEDFPNSEAPDSDYPYGRTRDRNGSTPGTPVNEYTHGDIHQFFARLLSQAGIAANGMPDNDYSGWQFMQSLGLLAFYKHTSVSSLAIATGSKTFTIEGDRHAYKAGMYAQAVDQANASNFMKGFISSVTDTTIVVLVTTIGGSGTISAWDINLGMIDSGTWIPFVDTPTGDCTGVASNTDYRKTGLGEVSMRGIAVFDTSISTAQANIGTLPVGYRPSTSKRFSCACYVSSTGDVLVANVIVGTNGVLQYAFPVGSLAAYNNCFIHLDQIKFFID